MSSAPTMPALFVGHGSPKSALGDTPWSRGWTALGAALPTPKAILCISAHWYVRGTYVTGEPQPKQIYDFTGFPAELYRVQYPARGDVQLAQQIAGLVDRALVHGGDSSEDGSARRDGECPGPGQGQQGGQRRLAFDWGLDHGTWSFLYHLRPAADVPVLQLSIDRHAPMARHLELGRALAELRGEGVLIAGSGNLTHNLRHAMRWDGGAQPSWAVDFDAEVASAVEQRDVGFLTRALDGELGRRAHPSPDHYLPLLYVVGAAEDASSVRFPTAGFDLGSLSMRSILMS